jgi:hypothetical protein
VKVVAARGDHVLDFTSKQRIATTYRDFKDLLTDREIDVVDICTPPDARPDPFQEGRGPERLACRAMVNHGRRLAHPHGLPPAFDGPPFTYVADQAAIRLFDEIQDKSRPARGGKPAQVAVPRQYEQQLSSRHCRR